VRIWYQSYVDYENGRTYWDRLRAHLAAVVDPETTVDIKGITPHDSYAHALVEMRCAREVICNAVRAEREGYDAFVIGHFQDAGLYETRSAVSIPVVALGEASMLYSCQLGQRIGIVTINTRYIPWFHHQIKKYGLERRRADPGWRNSDAVVFRDPQSRGRWRSGNQWHSDRCEDGGNGGEVAPALWARRQPRLRLRPATQRDPGRVHESPEGALAAGGPWRAS
jgi:hypothetical protein